MANRTGSAICKITKASVIAPSDRVGSAGMRLFLAQTICSPASNKASIASWLANRSPSPLPVHAASQVMAKLAKMVATRPATNNEARLPSLVASAAIKT